MLFLISLPLFDLQTFKPISTIISLWPWLLVITYVRKLWFFQNSIIDQHNIDHLIQNNFSISLSYDLYDGTERNATNFSNFIEFFIQPSEQIDEKRFRRGLSSKIATGPSISYSNLIFSQFNPIYRLISLSLSFIVYKTLPTNSFISMFIWYNQNNFHTLEMNSFHKLITNHHSISTCCNLFFPLIDLIFEELEGETGLQDFKHFATP